MTTKTWTGSSSTNWNDPNNWSPPGVPASGDDVAIGGTPTSPVLNASTTVNTISITASNTLTLSGAATVLTVTNGIALGSTAGIGGQGTLAANLTGGGTVTASGGTLHLTKTVASGPTLAIDANVANSRLSIEGAAIAVAPIVINNFNQTLAIEASGNLTINGGNESITNGAIAMAMGAQLSDNAGFTIGAGAALFGAGLVTGPIMGIGAIVATGGTLELAGTVTDSGTALTLEIFAAGDRLLLDAASTAHAVTFNNSSGTLEVGVNAMLTVGTRMDIGSGTLKLDSGNAVFNDAIGVTLGGGQITGNGTLAANLLSGSTGTVTASGGALALTGTVASGVTLAIDANTANSRLSIENNAIAAAPIAINNFNQTLAIETSGNLTINGGNESITNGAIAMAMGAQLSDNAGFTIGSGAALSGAGKVTGAINGPSSGTSAIIATGGTLELVNAVTDSGNALTLTIDGATDRLLLDATSTAKTVTFNSSGTLELVDDNLTLTVADPMAIGAGTLKLTDAILTDTSGAVTLSTGTITGGNSSVKAAVTATGAAHITSTGGTLDMLGNITDNGTLSLTLAAANAEIDLHGVSTATTVTFVSTGSLNIQVGATLTVGTAMAIGKGSVLLFGSTLTDAQDVTLGGGGIGGVGTLNAGVSGTGTIIASSGTLHLTKSIASGPTLAIDTVAGSALSIESTATAAAPITIDNANQTLAIEAAGNLTINGGGESITNGAIAMAMGAFLRDDTGFTIGSGAALVGAGTVTGAINGPSSGTSAIIATGGTLELVNAVTDTNSALTLTVDGMTDRLLLDSGAIVSQVTFNSSGTLELGLNASLTVSTAMAIGAGTLKLDGAALTDMKDVTLSTGAITGNGGVSAPVTATGAATITAAGGTLEMFNAITDMGNALTLTIAGASDRLLLFVPGGAAKTVTFGSSGTLELAAGAALTVADQMMIGAGTLQLIAGATLSDAMVTLSTGTITGAGKLAATVTASDAATITANGGTLEVTGAISDGKSLLALTITGAKDRLLLDNGGAANAVSFNGSSGTLELGSSKLTVGTALTIGAGTLKLDGVASLADTMVTLSTGTITGAGRVLGPVMASDAAHITANGGTLEVTGAITDGKSLLALAIIAANDRLLLDNGGAAQTVTFGSSGTLELGANASLTVGTQMAIGSGTLKLDGAVFTDAMGATLGGGQITGFGTFNPDILSGSTGTVTASGGSLLLAGTVASGPTLAIDTATLSALVIESTATAAVPIAIDSANQTLAIAASGNLMIDGGIESIANGTIFMAPGSQLTDIMGFTIGTSAALIGAGTVNGAIGGSGTVIASGGVLHLTDPVASGPALAIDNAQGGTLSIESTATAAVPIAINNANQTLAIGASGNLTINGGAESITNGSITLAAGGQLSDTAAGFTIGSNARLIGAGIVNGPIGGTGFVGASGGTLHLTGTVASGPILAIDAAKVSVLSIESTATAAAPIAINNTNQALAIGASGNLTINGGPESITFGFINLAAGGQLRDDAGFMIGSSGKLIGSGKVTGAIGGSGLVGASGGTLELVSAIAASAGTTFAIANAAAVDLQLDGTVGTGNTFTFFGSTGQLGLGNDTGFNDTISGLNEGTSTTVPTNFIDIEGKLGITATGTGTINSGTITLSDGTTLNLSNITNFNTAWFANTVTDAAGTGTDVFISNTPCFCRGTRILTENGEVPVEDLAVGDRVVTLSGALKPIVWIGVGRSLVTRANKLARPVIVRRGALAENVPVRDLYLTHGHALYLGDVLIPVENLVNHRSIVWDESAGVVEYYHLELADHDVLFADGAPTESYYDAGNRAQFHNTRPGSAAGVAKPSFAPVLSGGEIVELVWLALFRRAGGRIETDTTDDPDLHLVVDGERLMPAIVAGCTCTFALDAPPSGALHLRSRTGVPSLLGVTAHDHRRLGVAISRIVVGQPGILSRFEHDAPQFTEGGCHPAEQGYCWTDGELTLPAPLFRHLTGEFTLTIEIERPGMRYPISPAVAAAA